MLRGLGTIRPVTTPRPEPQQFASINGNPIFLARLGTTRPVTTPRPEPPQFAFINGNLITMETGEVPLAPNHGTEVPARHQILARRVPPGTKSWPEGARPAPNPRPRKSRPAPNPGPRKTSHVIARGSPATNPSPEGPARHQIPAGGSLGFAITEILASPPLCAANTDPPQPT